MNEYGGADDEAARDPCFFHPRLADREVGAEEGGDAYGAEKSAAFRTKQTSSIYKHAPLSDNVTSHRHERRATRIGREPPAHLSSFRRTPIEPIVTAPQNSATRTLEDVLQCGLQ